MNRSLKLSMLIALALGSSQVLALDMGQIQVKSALWQPLLAEIPISAATPAELKGITVELASSEEFARAGIVGGRPTVPLTFNVVTVGGHSVIRVTSTVAVNDPYLDLLVQVNGHSGKSVREFAVLLDPPNSSLAGPVAPAAAPSVATPASAPASNRSETRPPRHMERDVAHAAPTPEAHTTQPIAKPHRESSASAVAANGQYGPVKSGQTLSSIARSTAASAGVSMDQMLVALKQANPDAFYRDNINALKRGVVLRIPVAADAKAMEAAAAIAEVQRQNSDWRAGRVGKSVAVANAGARSSASDASDASTNASTDRLALVSASDKSGSADQNGRAGGKGDTTSAGIRQELQRTKESLASVQQQDSDLKSRLQDLTDINSKNDHLLSLKDSEIADLQNKLAAARKAAGLPAQAASVVAASASTKAPPASAAVSAPVNAPAAAASAPVSSASTAGTAPMASSSSAPTAASSTVAPAVAASAPAVAKPMPTVNPAPMPVAEEPWYMQTWAWAAGAGAIVVLALLAVLGRRRKAAAVTPPVDSSLADRFSPELIGHDPSDFDQNELLDQLAEHPDDIGLHLELVTLYYSRRDVDHFEAAAEAMHAHITDPEQDEWQDVLNMGEDLAPGHPLFDNHEELPPPDFDETRRAFDLDDYPSELDLPSESAAHPVDHFSAFDAGPKQTPPELPPAKTVSEYNLDFDLNTPFRAPPKPPFSAAEADAEHVTASAPPELPTEPFVDAPASAHAEEPADAAYNLDDFHASSADRLDEFNDDPVDTKLDLARAYVDMGDTDGARAMLGEVIKEGTQIQQEVARRIIETLD